MQPQRSLDVVLNTNNVQQPQPEPQATQPVIDSVQQAFATPPQQIAEQNAANIIRRRKATRRAVLFISVAVLLATAVVIALINRSNQATTLNTGNFKNVNVPLSSIEEAAPLLTDTNSTLKVNGQLQVANSIVLAPSAVPAVPVAGQIYYDEGTNLLNYYNGQQYVSVGNSTSNVTNVTNGTTNGVQLQGSSPGTAQNGNFNISGTGKVGVLETNVLSSNGSTLYLNPLEAVNQQQVAEGTPATLGLVSGGLNSGTGWQNTLDGVKATTGNVGGVATSMSITFGGGTGSSHVQMAIYDDDGDVPSKPGSLLVSSAVGDLVPNGTTTLSIPSFNLNANTTYWLVMKTDDTTVTRPYVGDSKASCFVSSLFGFMPAQFSAGGCFFDDLRYQIYVNYTTGSIGDPGSFSPAAEAIGPTGQVVFRNSIDSNAAFQIQNAAGTSTIFSVDSQNGRIGIGKTNPAYKLDISAGDINLSSGRSLRFAGQQALTVTDGGASTFLTNLSPGGTISIQAASVQIQDVNGSHSNMAIAQNGATTFSNITDTDAGFVVQNAAGVDLFTIDTSGRNIFIGDPAGSSTPVLLYLANKNTSGDPVGDEGATYYNSTLASFRCFRNNFWQNCADLEPQHSFSLYDEFAGGQTTFTGQIGSLGWNAAAIGANGSLALNPGTPTPSANRPGVLGIQTPASANQGSTLMLGDSSGASILIAADNNLKTAVATGAATNQVLRIGLHNETTTTTQPVSGVWWEADPATNANWRYCFGNGTTATCAATSVAIAANSWVTLEIRVTATGNGTSAATFVINNTPFTVSGVTIDSTNRVSPALSCYGTNGSAQNCYWDYFQLTGTTSAQR